MLKNNLKKLVNFMNNYKIIILSSLIYWIIIVFSTIFFILIGFHSDSYLVFYIYESFAIFIVIAGILIFKYFTGLIKSKDEILLTLNLITISVILLSIPGTFILMAIGAQLIERLPNFRTFGNEGDWINLIGIIIAGTITMLGITFTIRSEQKIREEESKKREFEIAIASTPVIILDFSDEQSKKPNHFREKRNNDDQVNLKIYNSFIIKNTSNYFAIIKEFKLSSIEVNNIITKNTTNINPENILIYDFNNEDIIPPNTSKSVKYNLNCDVYNFSSILLHFNLVYTDFMKTNNYSIDATLRLFTTMFDKEDLKDYYSKGKGIHVEDDEFYIEVVYSDFVNKFNRITN